MYRHLGSTNHIPSHKDDTLCAMVFPASVFSRVFLYSVRPLSLQRFSKPCWFFKMYVADQHVVIRWKLCTPFGTNVQPWSEQVNWNHLEINEWPLTQRIPAPGERAQISVLEASVHDAQCILQRSCNRIVPLSISFTPPCHAGQSPLAYHSIVPKVCIEVSQKDHEFVSFDFSQDITSFFHVFRVQ